jgi:hypothetical protein
VASTDRMSPGEMARLIRRGLATGRRVEIERLGVFRPAASGGVEFRASSKPKVFLAYATEDGARVDALYLELKRAGCAPWMDRRKLLAGQNWPRAIEGAIETADFFVACLSKRALRKRGIFQSEMRYALDCARATPFDDIFFIPVRLEECRVPRQIRRETHYIDLFPDFEAGAKRLARLIRAASRRRE